MDVLWIAAAYLLGLLARRLSLPPLVGYLAAGFLLHAAGRQPGPWLGQVADLGITLLLFAIGLKLRPAQVLRPQVSVAALGHAVLITGLVLALLAGLAGAGMVGLVGRSVASLALVAFALSFSSTVVTVKLAEEGGTFRTLHARIAIGILIVQDLMAVVFLALSKGQAPTVWAAAVVAALLLLRPLWAWMLRQSGHGELLLLFGVGFALAAGHAPFEAVGLKGDLGALLAGVVLAGRPKAEELSRALLGLKDLLLVAFFLGIGLAGAPPAQALPLVAVLVLLVPVKAALHVALQTALGLRARTGLLTGLALAHHSEFGLIVASVAYGAGWLPQQSLAVLALAVGLSFVFAGPLYRAAPALYQVWHRPLLRLQRRRRLPEEQPIDVGDAEILVFGMGRVGVGTYDAMRERFGHRVLGLDSDLGRVERHRREGREVLLADASDPDLWERLPAACLGRLRLVMLAMSDHRANLRAARELHRNGLAGRVAATARFADHMEQLEQEGVAVVFNFYQDAGAGFADRACAHFPNLERG
jgi:predicted Kef-type K+ transport protein